MCARTTTDKHTSHQGGGGWYLVPGHDEGSAEDEGEAHGEVRDPDHHAQQASPSLGQRLGAHQHEHGQEHAQAAAHHAHERKVLLRTLQRKAARMRETMNKNDRLHMKEDTNLIDTCDCVSVCVCVCEVYGTRETYATLRSTQETDERLTGTVSAERRVWACSEQTLVSVGLSAVCLCMKGIRYLLQCPSLFRLVSDSFHIWLCVTSCCWRQHLPD